MDYFAQERNMDVHYGITPHSYSVQMYQAYPNQESQLPILDMFHQIRSEQWIKMHN